MLLLSGFQRSSFIKLCKRTPLASSLSSKLPPKVQLSHWLSVERASLSVLKLLSWSCHIHVILTLCLPPLHYISLLSCPSYVHFSSLGRAHLCVAFMWSTSHWHLNCWSESPGNFRAWMSFYFYSYLQEQRSQIKPFNCFQAFAPDTSWTLRCGAPHFAYSPHIPNASQIHDPSAASGINACSVWHARQPSVVASVLLSPLAELFFPSVRISEAIGVAKHATHFPPPCSNVCGLPTSSLPLARSPVKASPQPANPLPPCFQHLFPHATSGLCAHRMALPPSRSFSACCPSLQLARK